MILIIIVILIIFYILNSKKIEGFKTELIYTPKYINDPISLEKYKINSDNRIQSNIIDKNMGDIKFKPKHLTCVEPINFIPQNVIKIDSDIDFGKRYITGKMNDVKIDKLDNKKYTLHGDDLFNFKPAGNLINLRSPIIDQSITTNIMHYVNNGIQTIPQKIEREQLINVDDNEIIIKQKVESTIGKTISQIYDDITNDGRLDIQQNLDELDANDKRDDYEIGKKYGATKFDTYSL